VSILPYLAVKAAEYSATINWIEWRLQSLPTLNEAHPTLSALLTQRIHAAQKRINRLKTIVSLGLSQLARRAVSVVNELEYDVIILSHYYLPALLKESLAEGRFRIMALSAAKRSGLDWVDDIIVCLQGGHAVIPTLDRCPLLFAPPHQATTLLDLPGMFHEFGHIIYLRFQDVPGTLSHAVQSHFRDLEQAPAPLDPQQQVERRKAIVDAATYWNFSRLNELFCDIYATYVCGPAHYYSFVDLAIRSGEHPYEVDHADEHPPLGARVEACRMSLFPHHAGSHFCRDVGSFWQAHTESEAPGAEFKLICGAELLRVLVDAGMGAIQRVVPTASRYVRDLAAEVPSYPATSSSLEELLNDAVVALLKDPEGYPGWERPFVEALYSSA